MDDTPALLAYLQQPTVTELTSYPAPSLALAEGIIARATNRWAAGEPSKWGLALHGNDHLIGTCGFNEWSPVHRWAELAYDLAPPHWGKGLMRQAVNAALRWAFEQVRLGRIHAHIRTDNTRSKRLLERAGFSQEGRLRHFRVCRGQPHDFDVYSLLDAEWAGAHRAEEPKRAVGCTFPSDTRG